MIVRNLKTTSVPSNEAIEAILNPKDTIDTSKKAVESYDATHSICVKALDYLMF